MGLSTVSMADVDSGEVQAVSGASIPAGNAGNGIKLDLGRYCRAVTVKNDAGAAQPLFVARAEFPQIGATQYDFKAVADAVLRKFCTEIPPGGSYVFGADQLQNSSIRYLYLVASSGGAIASGTKILKD